MLKIPHVSDDSFLDARVERMAYLSRKRNWSVYFAGPRFDSFALGENIFDGLCRIDWNRYARLSLRPHRNRVKCVLKSIICSVKPDIIHAHNLFAAKIVSDLDYPFIFDVLTSYQDGRKSNFRRN